MKRQIAIVTENNVSLPSTQYTIRPLSSNNQITVDSAEVSPIQPAPADIPLALNEVDAQLMTECLSKEDLQIL